MRNFARAYRQAEQHRQKSIPTPGPSARGFRNCSGFAKAPGKLAKENAYRDASLDSQSGPSVQKQFGARPCRHARVNSHEFGGALAFEGGSGQRDRTEPSASLAEWF